MRKEAGSYPTIQKVTPAPRDGICRWCLHRICGVRCGVDCCPPGCLRGTSVIVRRFGAVGLSNVRFEEYRAAQAITEVACVQNAYNLADRSDQALLDACAADGVAYVPFFPLGSAFHPDKPVLTAPAVVATPTARRHNRPGGTGLAPAALSEPATDPWNVLAYPPSRESRGS